MACLLSVDENVEDDEALSERLIHRVFCNLVDVAYSQVLIGVGEFSAANADIP